MIAVVGVRQFHLINVEQRQTAVDSHAKPPIQAARVYTHHRRLLLLLNPKADTFTARCVCVAQTMLSQDVIRYDTVCLTCSKS